VIFTIKTDKANEKNYSIGSDLAIETAPFSKLQPCPAYLRKSWRLKEGCNEN
jgi:hypothetical protein